MLLNDDGLARAEAYMDRVIRRLPWWLRLLFRATLGMTWLAAAAVAAWRSYGPPSWKRR